MLTEMYPLAFKKCMLIPLYKAGDKLFCDNYRPITLSLTLPKFFEKSIKYRLVEFLEKKIFLFKFSIWI